VEGVYNAFVNLACGKAEGPFDSQIEPSVNRVERFRRAITDRDLSFGNEARELYDMLIGPAHTDLANKTSLIIVPDGPLWELSFQALQSAPNRFLIEDCTVSYAPSLTTLFQMTRSGALRRKRPNMLLAIGNPAVGQETAETVQSLFMDERLGPLPEAERLVITVGRMYGTAQSKIYTGTEAREDRVKTEAPKYGIIHIAAHGILNDKSPMYSQLVLSQADGNPNEDGLLEAWEVMNLDLKANLVILSACETARGHIGNGEGVIGLSWASFVAGAPTTVVSQWKVETGSTTELMIEFHRNLRMGKSKAQALRLAALKLSKTEQYRHPFYWAGFVIIGDAK
jgi:CHAT domain-containing protein